jgi:transcriptional regulator with XRE-family HTH domain
MINFRLMEAYRTKGMRQKELAELAGIEKTRMCRIVNGGIKPTKEERQIIAKILRKTQKSLF